MKFLSTSYWHFNNSNEFELCGVIVVNTLEWKVYFPDHQDERRDWEGVLGSLHQGANLKVWLEEIVETGNGITDEFGPLMVVDAKTIQEASEQAYSLIEKQFGLKMQLFDPADQQNEPYGVPVIDPLKV